jgi:hydroxypyruvate reductase
MDAQRLMTTTLRAADWGPRVARIMAAALSAVEPAAAVRQHLQRDGTRLNVAGQTYDLQDYARVLLVGAGKAGAPMAQAAADILGAELREGIVIVKAAGAEPGTADPHVPSAAPRSSVTVLNARHPLPDERGVTATRRIATLLESTSERDLVLVLISGGGSALLTLPAPDITLDDMEALTQALLACGASIDEINMLRKQLDLVKGGGLARMAAPATLITLILSDVVGNPLDVIASGPTVPNRSSFADAYAVLERYELIDRVPAMVVARLQAGMRGAVAETPGAGDPIFARVQNVLIGSNAQAAAAALEAARAEGFHPLLLTTFAQGEARVVGRLLAAVACELVASGQPVPRPACVVLGGETTVTLRGQGRGGRNQELALAAVRDMAGLADVALITLATDGGDGPTDAAGAVVTGETLARATEQQLDPDAYLANNDAYAFFAALGDLLQPGPTNTNVNDLAFVLAF